MRIGIIGCGSIASEIISRSKNVVAVYDICPDKCKKFGIKICGSIEELIEESDLIIEAASTEAVKEYASKIIDSGKDLLIMSIGGLVDDEFRDSLFKKAFEKNVNIYLPSGAIGGLDIIKTAKIAGLNKVTIKSTKNAKILGVDCKTRTRIFKGTAREAIKRFPKSTNVTVLLMIITGMDIEVEIYADPDIKYNVHEIYIEGAFGSAEITIKNHPTPENPKTSYLAALSPISILEYIDKKVLIGV